MHKVEVVNAIQLVKKNPSMFFDAGVPTQDQLISAVMRDLAEVGDLRSNVLVRGPLSIVSADVDWLVTQEAKFLDLFSCFVIPRSRRPNSHRAEVLINAVSSGFLATGKGQVFSRELELKDLPEDFVELAKQSVRSLIWTLKT